MINKNELQNSKELKPVKVLDADEIGAFIEDSSSDTIIAQAVNTAGADFCVATDVTTSANITTDITSMADATDCAVGNSANVDMDDKNRGEDYLDEYGVGVSEGNISTSNLPALSSEAGFHKYLRQINAIPSLTKEEEFMLAKNYLEQNDLEAAHKLVASHLKLVAKIALQYRNYGLPATDLISEGSLGLMQAVKKYDPSLGHRLSTYAMWWIKASVQEYVLKSWSLVKIGTTAAQKKLFFSLSKIKHRIRNTHGRDVHHGDYENIANDLGVSIKEVEDMTIRLSGPDTSLNNPLKNDDSEGGEVIDILAEDAPSHELSFMNSEVLANKTQILFEALATLNEREAKILQARKLTDTPSTLDSLSVEYNISKERVRQIENRAFEKVQAHVLAKVSEDGQIKRI